MMRKLLFVLLVLIALGAIPASADIFVPSVSYDSTEYDYFPPATYSAAFPYMITPNESQITAFCAALGHGTHTNEYTWKSFTDNTHAYGGSMRRQQLAPPGRNEIPNCGYGVYRMERINMAI